jgi:hypothetical protein
MEWWGRGKGEQHVWRFEHIMWTTHRFIVILCRVRVYSLVKCSKTLLVPTLSGVGCKRVPKKLYRDVRVELPGPDA